MWFDGCGLFDRKTAAYQGYRLHPAWTLLECRTQCVQKTNKCIEGAYPMRFMLRPLLSPTVSAFLTYNSTSFAQNSVPVELIPYAEKVEWPDIWSCNANFGQRCEDFDTFSAPDGYQVCRLSYKHSKGREADITFTPAAWLANDDQKPPRFRSYKGRIYAAGSRSIVDRWGSNINVSNIVLWVIPASADNNERRSRGCVLPSR